jgi:hypothetical protein
VLSVPSVYAESKGMHIIDAVNDVWLSFAHEAAVARGWILAEGPEILEKSVAGCRPTTVEETASFP